ncbi:hypothetical protein NMY22_g9639 [Coprinellus aureogranulatus]|nr:hypothetical protein NMY22_g9639 [Coprinellus aureogranulatus]
MFNLNTFTIAIAAVLAVGANAQQFGLTADQNLCNGAGSGYACASTPNLPGPPLNQFPTYPWVIGLPNTGSPDSPNCGDCYQLTYTPTPGDVRIRNVTVVNNSGPGIITLCTDSYRNLTGITGPLPPVPPTVTLTEVARSVCGL